MTFKHSTLLRLTVKGDIIRANGYYYELMSNWIYLHRQYLIHVRQIGSEIIMLKLALQLPNRVNVYK